MYIAVYWASILLAFALRDLIAFPESLNQSLIISPFSGIIVKIATSGNL